MVLEDQPHCRNFVLLETTAKCRRESATWCQRRCRKMGRCEYGGAEDGWMVSGYYRLAMFLIGSQIQIPTKFRSFIWEKKCKATGRHGGDGKEEKGSLLTGEGWQLNSICLSPGVRGWIQGCQFFAKKKKPRNPKKFEWQNPLVLTPYS